MMGLALTLSNLPTYAEWVPVFIPEEIKITEGISVVRFMSAMTLMVSLARPLC
jgi:hypothetical protein